MANPSTQPPSNAATSDIVFAREFMQGTYTLLELPKSLEDYIKDAESNPDSDGASLRFVRLNPAGAKTLHMPQGKKQNMLTSVSTSVA